MEKHINCDKMIIAVLQGDDYRVAIEDLNSKGFYATVLHSTDRDSSPLWRRRTVCH